MPKMKEGDNKDGKEEVVEVVSDLPVDRGYAWVILFATAMVLFLVLGALKCFGVFYVEVASQYDVSSKEIQSIQSLTGFFYMGLGPVANVLSIRFSSRSVIFVGGLFCGLGFLLTAFAPSVGYFYVTYGCITGFGYGLSFSPCILTFVHYFEKKRALANGIITGGGGLGAVVLPLLMRYLIDVWSLGNCMMLFAGILFNICVFACLLRPYDNYPVKKRVIKNMGSRVSNHSHDASDLIQYDDKSYISAEDGRSQSSFVSDGESLLKSSRRRSKQKKQLANASTISLKSFNPSLYTNPDPMTKSMCSEDQLSVDITGRYDKQMNASVISLKSFDPSVCSNIDPGGVSICSEFHTIEESTNNLRCDDKQLNASVISLKSFDPSMSSNIDALGKSMYSEDQQSIGVASLGDTSRKQSLGVDSIDESIRETFHKNKFNVSITESQMENMEDSKSQVSKNQESDQISGEQDNVISGQLEEENLKLENDTHKPILKNSSQRKKRHLSEGNGSLKAYSTSDNQFDKKEDSVSHGSSKVERESLFKSVAWLKKDDRKHFTASLISLKSYDPSLCASLGVVAGISMQSIPMNLTRHDPPQITVTPEQNPPQKSGPCFTCKQIILTLDWGLFKNPIFLMYLIFVFSESLGYLGLFNILPPYCEEINATPSEGALIISIISVADLSGRLFFGFTNHIFQRQNRIIYFFSCLIMAIGIIVTPQMKTFLHLAILCAIYGFFTGGYNGVMFSLIVKSLGLERFSRAWGFIAFSAALSLLLNPFEAGIIKDLTDSWAAAFRINGGVALFGCLMLPLIAIIENRQTNLNQEEIIEMDTNVDL